MPRATGGMGDGSARRAPARVLVVPLVATLALASACASSPTAHRAAHHHRPAPASTGPATSTVPASSVAVTPLTPTTTTPAATVSCSATPATPAAPTGTPGSLSATDGSATATVSWTSEGTPGEGYVLGGTVVLSAAGAAHLIDGTLTPPAPTNDTGADPYSAGWETVGPVCVEQPGSGLPVVYLVGYAGAMTCCTVVRVYYPTSAGSYTTLDRDTGRAGATVETLGGAVVVKTANRAFAGQFACEACSGLPLQVLQFAGGTLTDVTRRYPTQVAADAQQWWAGYQQNPGDPLGVLAAWAADECALGRQTQTFATLDTMAAAGQLNPTTGSPPTSYAFGPTGSAWVQALHTFLQQQGYIT